MPITARLSRRFYAKFGDEIVNDLVEWLNQVDLAFRTELQRTSDAEFRRIESRIDQRLAEFGAELRAEFRREIGAARGETSSVGSALREETSRLRNEIHAVKAELIKWMFLFWAGTALAGVLLK
jgi:hypothetical protein